VYYAATQQSAAVELAGFTDAVREALGTEGLPPGYRFPDWATALEFIDGAAGGNRLVVVLDEFPYLAASTRGLESIIQRWWDQRGRTSEVMLVLCGSSVAYMRQVTGAAAPLHQRSTLSMHVRPMDYRTAGEFVPRLAPADKAIVYGILGGTPLYLNAWDDARSVRANLVELFASPYGPLVDAAELVLSGELPEAEGAMRILQAVALGHTRPSAIFDYARVAVERPLSRLVTLGILERRVPALDDPARSRKAIYAIADPYFAFWFRFIAAARSHIARGLGRQLVETRILPGLDDHMGPIFEQMAREHARGLAASGAVDADRVEAWWSADGRHEVDLVGVRGPSHIGFVGTVKWSKRPLGRSVANDLIDHARAIPGFTDDTPLLLYCRGGCVPSLASTPHVRCHGVEAMYR
jgi:hypothetical protein